MDPLDRAPQKPAGIPMIGCLGGPLDGKFVIDSGRSRLRIERLAPNGPLRFERHDYERSGDLLLYVGRGR